MTRAPRPTTLWAIVLSTLAVGGWAVVGTARATAAQPDTGHGSATVIKRPVTFDVLNVNGTSLACPSDAAPYEVHGYLIAPASKLGSSSSSRRRAVTLYLHDFSLGAFFWNFSAVPRYDYAARMARAGHASVVIDRLGYGSSGLPEGDETCLGAQADIAHQVIGMLRMGDYAIEGLTPVRFDRVALAGHSVGGLIANLEAYSFNDVDGLVVVGYTPQVTQQAFQEFYVNRTVCEAGGERAHVGGPGGYAYFGQTTTAFRAKSFHRAEPAVMDLATRLRARDPCGDTRSIVDALVLDVKSLSRIQAPVLVVCGREDAVTPDFACPYLKRRYDRSGDVSLVFIPRSGHALPLERAAPSFRSRVSRWLDAHGL
jgi:pimeloyl-ACP methyl ester carboxylesterase